MSNAFNKTIKAPKTTIAYRTVALDESFVKLVVLLKLLLHGVEGTGVRRTELLHHGLVLNSRLNEAYI